MNELLIWFVAGVAVAALIVGVAMLLMRPQRRCPSCRVPLVPLPHAGPKAEAPTYEVLVCPTCSNALTLAQGARSRFTFCPECRQRTLETPCIRLPDSEEGRRRVEVHENCQLCGYMAIREVGDPEAAPAKRGQVLPFPPDRQKKKARND